MTILCLFGGSLGGLRLLAVLQTLGEILHLSDSDGCKILLTFDKCTKQHFTMTLVKTVALCMCLCVPLRCEVPLVEMGTVVDALVQDRKKSKRKALSGGRRPVSKRLENTFQAGSKPPQKSSKRLPNAKKTPFKTCKKRQQNLLRVRSL